MRPEDPQPEAARSQAPPVDNTPSGQLPAPPSTEATEPAAGGDPVDALPEVMLEGIDVSHHNGVVAWPQMRKAGIVFAVVKATEGVSWVDPELWDNWVGSRSVGLIRGAYHFLDADKDAVIQAQNFLDHVQLEAGDLPPILDVEQAKDETPEDLDHQARLWLKTVHRFTGHRAILYSGRNFLDKFMPTGFEDHPLWLAEYGQSVPILPNGWHDWTFWQYTQKGRVSGVTGDVDRTRFAGDLEALRSMLIQ